tara:strand:- start:9031 stop:9666 length:636 start_codon:yes stop_codon:yes gene_type:complete
MDFRPKEVILTKNSNGTISRHEVWNYDTLAGVELAGSLVNLLYLIFVFFMIAPYFLLLSLATFCGRFNYINIIGAVIGGYVLYDAYNGWVFTIGMHIIFNESIFNYIIILNAVSVVIHVFLAIFGTITHKLIVDNFVLEETRKKIFIFIIVILGLITYAVSLHKTKSNPGWMEDKIQNNLYEIRHEQEVKDSLAHLIELKKMEDYEREAGY